MKTILDEHHLNLETVHELLSSGRKIDISSALRQRVEDCRKYLDQKLENVEKPIYGINTGFGSLCSTVIPSNELNQLQTNLVRSHACGTGDVIDNQLVKLILLLKVKSLCHGYSGITITTVEQLLEFYNHDILPVIYEQGSLGASGDLAPLAHMALALMGEGEADYKNQKQPTEQILNQVKLAPIELVAKEGLALLNGTQFMSAHLVHCLLQAYQLWHAAHAIAALSCEAFNGRPDAYYAGLGNIRPHEGQLKSAETMRRLLTGSGLETAEDKAVQDPYSFRCIPQVHGATYTTLEHCKRVAECEINSVTDNPVIFAEDDKIISGGNFHGQELALALDFLAIAMSELANISERRSYLLVSGTRNLPAYLTPKPGTNSGFMIPQYTAASIVSQNKQLCSPASVDSIPSSNGQEDHVSMGANAATKCKRVIDNVRTVLAIELMLAAQAWELRKGFEKAPANKALVAAYREHVDSLADDRYLSTDIKASEGFVKNYFQQL